MMTSVILTLTLLNLHPEVISAGMAGSGGGNLDRITHFKKLL